MTEAIYDSYYMKVITALSKALQQALMVEETCLSKLVQREEITQLTNTQLKELLDNHLSQLDVIVRNDFFSVQQDVSEQRKFFVKLFIDGELVGQVYVPLNEHGQFEVAEHAKTFFEQLLTVLYEVRIESFQQQFDITLSRPSNILAPKEKEMDDMEKINRLNFKEILKAPAAERQDVFETEENMESHSLHVEEEEERSQDLFDGEVIDDSFLLSTMVNIDIEDNYEDEYEDEYEELSTNWGELLPADEMVEEVDAFDELLKKDEASFGFDSINEQLNAVYKASPTNEREKLKQIKATIWELELKQEEEPLIEADLAYLLQNVLSVQSDEVAVLKWQLHVVRTLLNR